MQGYQQTSLCSMLCGKDSSLEEPEQHQALVLVVYVRAVDAAIDGEHSDVLGCDALAGAGLGAGLLGWSGP